jgi:hypothetical protein
MNQALIKALEQAAITTVRDIARLAAINAVGFLITLWLGLVLAGLSLLVVSWQLPTTITGPNRLRIGWNSVRRLLTRPPAYSRRVTADRIDERPAWLA